MRPIVGGEPHIGYAPAAVRFSYHPFFLRSGPPASRRELRAVAWRVHSDHGKLVARNKKFRLRAFPTRGATRPRRRASKNRGSVGFEALRRKAVFDHELVLEASRSFWSSGIYLIRRYLSPDEAAKRPESFKSCVAWKDNRDPPLDDSS